jgi:transcription-repair coupling factor (superfamily II helicase)
MRGLLPLGNQAFEDALNSNRDIIAPPSSFAYLISLRATRKPILVITASSRAAEDLTKEIRECHADTLEFPAWETLPHERLSPSSDTVARRISTLQELQDKNRNWVVVAPIRAVIHKFNSQIVNTKPIVLESRI